MGFPGEEAVWSAAAGGALFPGAGGSMPGFWSFVAIVACIAILAVGQMYESKKYKEKG